MDFVLIVCPHVKQVVAVSCIKMLIKCDKTVLVYAFILNSVFHSYPYTCIKFFLP